MQEWESPELLFCRASSCEEHRNRFLAQVRRRYFRRNQWQAEIRLCSQARTERAMASSGKAGGVHFSNKNWEGAYKFYLKIFGGGSVLRHYTFLKTTAPTPLPWNVINDRCLWKNCIRVTALTAWRTLQACFPTLVWHHVTMTSMAAVTRQHFPDSTFVSR